MTHDPEQFELDIRAVKRAESDLCISKNNDYGPFNIARAPGGAINGLAVRLHDKIARLAHLLETGADPEHESVKDTFMDIANYGSIGTMVLEGLWPGVDDEEKETPQLKEPLARPAVFDYFDDGLFGQVPATDTPLGVGDQVRVTDERLRAYFGREGQISASGVSNWDWSVSFPEGLDASFYEHELERV